MVPLAPISGVYDTRFNHARGQGQHYLRSLAMRQRRNIGETSFISVDPSKWTYVKMSTVRSHRRCTSLFTPERHLRKIQRRHVSEIRRCDPANNCQLGGMEMEQERLLISPSDDPSQFDYQIVPIDENSHPKRNNGRSSVTADRSCRPARPWPCRPCGLVLGVCHVLLGVSVIVFDVSTNWITETVFAITAGVCFMNSGIVGLIAARKLDRGSVTLLIIFSFLSLGLAFVLIIECSAALNHVCGFGASTAPTVALSLEMGKHDQPDKNEMILDRCVNSVEAKVRTVLLILALFESIVDIVSIYIGAKSLCGRYEPDLERPSSPYHALIYGNLAPPARPKRIVQDVGSEGAPGKRGQYRLLLEYLIPSSSAVGEPSDRNAWRM